MISLIVGAAVAGATYFYAKKKRASTAQSATAAAVTGAGAAGTTWLALTALAMAWPVVLLGGAAAGAYYLGKKNAQKALPPSRG